MSTVIGRVGSNPHPFDSPEWHRHNQQEIAARPSARPVPAPISPAELDKFRPQTAPVRTAQLITANELARQLGVPHIAAKFLMERFTSLEAQIAELQQQLVPAHMRGVEKRG